MLMLPVSRINQISDPFANNIWYSTVISKEDVWDALADKRLIGFPYNDAEKPDDYDHAGRIAYLARYDWTDAITVNIDVPDIDCFSDWIVEDGNHRFAAAIYRGDAEIGADVTGCNVLMFELFGVNYPEGL